MTSLPPEDGRRRQLGAPTTVPSSSTTQETKGLPVGLGEDADTDAALVMAMIQARQLEEKKRAWASWVDVQYTHCKNSRAAFERQWYLNLAFLTGKQYVSPVEVSGYGFRLTAPKAPPHRVRLVVNKIRPAVRTECAKLTSSKPVPTVVPATNEDEDTSAAGVGEALIKAEFANGEFGKKYRSWVWWGVVTGVSFMKSYFDPNELDFEAMVLPPMPTQPDGTPFPADVIDEVKNSNPEVKQLLETPRPAQGKICHERLTPFQLYVPDLLAEEIEDQPYVIEVHTKTPLWVEKRYGFKPTPDARGANTIMDSVTIIAKNAEQHFDAVLVKECWIKPNAHPDFPDGGMLTVINGQVVNFSDKWPLPFRDFPYYKFDSIRTGGFYPDSVITDLIPLQKEYNRTRSQAIEIKNLMTKPRFLYPEGSVNIRKVGSEPGGAIPYTQGYEKPQILPAVEVPNSYVNELTQLTQEFDDISGQHEISRGGTPSGITSGTAIAFLQEQDDTKLADQVASIEAAMEKLGNHYLKYVTTYWSDDRIIKVTGNNNSFEAMHWKKGSLKGNTDVKVQSGSALPYSKAAKQALITEWMQNGFIAPEMGMEILNMGAFDKAVDDFLVDKRQAQRENLKMAELPEQLLTLLLSPAPGPNGEEPIQDPASGQHFNGDGTPFQPQPPIPVNSWDDHEQHIHWHNQYRKTQQFELLPEANKRAFELHVQLHQMSLSMDIVNTQGQTIVKNKQEAPPGFGNEEEGQEEQPEEGAPQEQSSESNSSGGPPSE